MEIIRLHAKNDANGNPRRLFVAIEGGSIVDVFDEGYRGTHAIPEPLRHLYTGLTFESVPAERRSLLAAFPKGAS